MACFLHLAPFCLAEEKDKRIEELCSALAQIAGITRELGVAATSEVLVTRQSGDAEDPLGPSSRESTPTSAKMRSKSEEADDLEESFSIDDGKF